jgi:serine/threonine protein kinase
MAGMVGQMLDRYRLDEQVGQGGMATVFRAVDTVHNQEFAIKVLSPTIVGDKRFVKRFRREAEFVKQRLNHPNIVPVVDYGESRGFIYLVMPFIKGETLDDKLAQGHLSKEQKARWIDQLSEALAYAHEVGIIHRDIKPSNVIIDESGDALLMDFGLAREIEGSSTLTGSMLMGTPAFISPEQARGEKLDSRSDQYSLGIILYKMATGRLPFDAETPMAIVLQHIQEQVPRPSRFNRDLSASEEKVIVKTLAKQRGDRFPSMTELNKAYQAALDGRRMPEFDLPPPGATLPMMRREALTMPQEVVQPPALPRTRSMWWILPVILLVVMGAAALAYPSISALLGVSTPESTLPPVPTSVATSYVPIFGNSTKVSTETPIPVIPTPITSNACPGIALHPPSVQGNRVTYLIDNNSESVVKIRNFENISWSIFANGSLNEITFGGDIIWEGETTSEDLSQSGLDLTLALNSVTPLVIKFEQTASKTGYTLNLVLDVGCTLGGNW